ncbi:hypothetical protein VN12_02425 [Pirellula sp. SH-Sr6A]|nr:hypothetical protein VN12_02425 [Pirellula sp. SH-Sr6A]
MLSKSTLTPTAWIALGIAASFTGCASLTNDSKSTKKKDDDKSWFSFKKKEYQIPQAMNVVWTYDILTIPGKAPTRGFGGRFYFYNEKTQAIPVDGELMVYGFDDSFGVQERPELSSATKRYKFTAEQLTSHFSEGQLGASYSVWIPWDAAPGEEKKIMLIPTFVAKDGKMVRGAAATVNLPGKTRVQPDVKTIMQVNAQLPVGAPTATTQAVPAASQQSSPSQQSFGGTPLGHGVTTINLPHRSAQRQLNTPDLVAVYEQLQQSGMGFEQGAETSLASNQELISSRMAAADQAIAEIAKATQPAAQTTMQVSSFFTPPTQMPIPSTGNNSNVVNPPGTAVPGGPANGWALPQLSQPAWTGLTPHFGPASPQAPASPTSPPSSYPTR